MRFLTVALLWALGLHAVAQIGVSDTVITSINPSAMLDVQGTRRGTLLSRMTTEQRLAIPNPAEGLLVYDLTKQKFYAFTYSGWRALQFEDHSVAPQELQNPLAGSGEFGHAVSIFGDYIAVGAPRQTVNGKSQQGAVSIFKKGETGFAFLTTIYPADGEAGDLFGYSLQISDTTLIVGSVLDDVGENINQGSVYVYGLFEGAWTFRYKLYGSNGAAGDEFGNTLHIRGDKLLVGAHFDDYATSPNQGSTYYFRLQNNLWTEKQKVFATDGTAGDEFGSDVFLEEEFMAVSSYRDDTLSKSDIGSVYIYKLDQELDTWEKISKTFPTDGNSYDFFGFSIVLSSNFLIVGSPYHDLPFNSKDRGAAYCYEILPSGQLSFIEKIVPPDNYVNDYYGDYFGTSIAVDGNEVLIGSHFEDNASSLIDRGAVFHYSVVNGQLIFKKTFKESSSNDQDIYGFSESLHNGTVVISAPYRVFKQGAIYIRAL